METSLRAAPEWDVERWFNTEQALDLASLRGKVVVAGAFQMLCPGCVANLLPQLTQVHRLFPRAHVEVIGLHTVFEHHAAMRPTSLEAFLYEYKIAFPVGVDSSGGPGDPLSVTMRRYAMRGTPTLLLIDREGRLRRQAFGHLPDLQVGAEIAALVGEALAPIEADVGEERADCADGSCAIRE